jgi:hypothetical protein
MREPFLSKTPVAFRKILFGGGHWNDWNRKPKG